MVSPVARSARSAATLVVLLVLSGCSFSFGGKSMDQAQVEKKVGAALEQQVGRAPDKVVCPGDLAAKVGTKMRCVLTADGTRYGVTLTVSSVKGDTVNFGIKVDDAPLGGSGGGGGQALKVGTAILASANQGAGAGAKLEVDAAAKECVGASVVKQLGASKAVEVSTTSFDKFSPVQQAAVVQALDKCLKGASVAGILVDSLYSELGPGTAASPAVSACVAGALEGKAGTVLFDLAQAGSTTPKSLIFILNVCVPKADLAAALKTAITSDGSVTPAQAECMVNKIVEQLTFGDLVAASEAPESPASKALQTQMAAAAQSCG